MESYPDKGRQAAHVLVDGVSSLHEGAPAIDLALQRLIDIEAFRVVLHDDGDEPVATVELTHVLGGALVAMSWLIGEAAAAQGVSRDEVILALRAYLDA